MSMKRKIKVTYISGPISGMEREEAERRFRTAEKMIEERREVPSRIVVLEHQPPGLVLSKPLLPGTM